MVPAMRKWFNENFTKEKYQVYLKKLNNKYPDSIDFRIAETPLFINKSFTKKILSTCESVIDVITQPNFRALTRNAVPEEANVLNETAFPHFIVFDFGICESEKGAIEPRLLEMQGFPSLFAYQAWHDEITRNHFNIPDNYSAYLNGFNKESYLQLLKEIIFGSHQSENVVLLELLPHQQKTRIDFYCTEEYIGVPIICLTELIKEGQKLYYQKDGRKIQIKRIYNRIIFNELQKQSAALQEKGKMLFEELDVEWVPHPNWFYRISKYTLPFINHPYVPQTTFLDEITELPEDLQNYVLKPLLSFAGQGVVIDVTSEDIANVIYPQNWILQRKVKYANVIKTPGEPVKAEIRIFYFWKEGAARPVATSNLATLSKGKMVGTRFNQNQEWVGSSQCYFEK
jgi:hypothetical protein